MDRHFTLNFRQILQAPAGRSPDQVIVDSNGQTRTYRVFHDRIARLSALLVAQGLGAGKTIAVMDWDTPRYLECFFAIPMVGATLHTVNIRLTHEQILYTFNHAEDDAILCHEDFLPTFLLLLPRIERPVKLILLTYRSDASVPGGGSRHGRCAEGRCEHGRSHRPCATADQRLSEERQRKC